MSSTVLHDAHVALGARMVEFAGWRMPVQYAGILQEHRHTRTAASVFDTCHMSEFRITGAGAEAALARALACRVRGMRPGQCRYGFLLNESGGILDDLVCCKQASDSYLVVANAGTRAQDARVLADRLAGRAEFEDVSDGTGKLDLQGPAALEVLNRLSDGSAAALGYYRFARMPVAGIDALVSRTGYTGELGYEVYVPADRVVELWQALLAQDGVKPAGLGARDTLRLEMGYPLMGHELNAATTPVEAGLDWALPAEGGYVGAEAIARRLDAGVGRRLVGVRFGGRRAARSGDPLLAEGVRVGEVTSGSYAPSLEAAVALGYVGAEHAAPGAPLDAEVRGTPLAGRVVRTPFYRDGTARRNTSHSERGRK